VLTYRRPDLRIGLACTALGVVFAVGYAAWQYVRSAAVLGSTSLPIDPGIVGSLNGSIDICAGVLVLTRLTLVFPDGRLTSATWRRVGSLATVLALIAAGGLLLGDGPLLVHPDRLNPLGLGGAAGTIARLAGLIGLTGLVACSGLSVVSLASRYRSGDQVVHQQVKWYAYGQAILAIAAVAYVVTTPITYAPEAHLAEFAWAGLMTAAIVPPVATALAIRRHALYQIDTIIGQTIVLSALTAILAGTYGALTQLFGSLFTTIAGDHSELTIVLTTLVITISFNPLREALERAVHRRFGTATDRGSGGDGEWRDDRRSGAGPSDQDLDQRIDRAVERALAARDRRATGRSTAVEAPDPSATGD
jgi:hypothetical protein